MSLLRTNLPDLYLADALPFVEHVIEEAHESYPYVSEKIYNMRDMKYGIAQHAQVSSLSAATQIAEAEEIAQQRVYQGYSTTFTALKYGILLATSQESIDDERWDSISKQAAKLGRAVAQTREVVAAGIFNDGHSTTLSDGKVLFATDHPLLTPGAGTTSNVLATAADLSIGTLKDMVTVFKKQLDTAGNKIHISPKYLLVPSELEYQAFELLKSIHLPEDNKNNINSMGPQGLYNLQPLCWEYLTDPDACYLLAEPKDTDLYWYWAKKPEIMSDEEFKSEVMLTRVTTRFTCGASDFRGLVSNGGGAS